MANTVAAKKTTRTPKFLWEISKVMAKLARGAFAQMRIAHSYRMKISKLELERDFQLDEIKLTQRELVVQLLSLARQHKAKITENGKSVTLASGQVGWRESQASVQIIEGHAEADIIKRMEKRAKRYLRYTPKINKAAILQAVRDGTFKGIRGIWIKQGEELFISLAPRGKDKPETIVVDAQ